MFSLHSIRFKTNAYNSFFILNYAFQATLQDPDYLMAGAKGVLQVCTTIIDMIQAKNVLDIGLYTGVSALTWALAIPEDGKVISMDVQEETYITFGKRIIEEVKYDLWENIIL